MYLFFNSQSSIDEERIDELNNHIQSMKEKIEVFVIIQCHVDNNRNYHPFQNNWT